MSDDLERARDVMLRLQTELLSTHLDAHERHEIGNILAIAQANIEAMVDGVLEPTSQRIRNVEDALSEASKRLHRSR